MGGVGVGMAHSEIILEELVSGLHGVLDLERGDGDMRSRQKRKEGGVRAWEGGGSSAI
jgi:hypothetical protein